MCFRAFEKRAGLPKREIFIWGWDMKKKIAAMNVVLLGAFGAFGLWQTFIANDEEREGRLAQVKISPINNRRQARDEGAATVVSSSLNDIKNLNQATNQLTDFQIEQQILSINNRLLDTNLIERLHRDEVLPKERENAKAMLQRLVLLDNERSQRNRADFTAEMERELNIPQEREFFAGR